LLGGLTGIGPYNQGYWPAILFFPFLVLPVVLAIFFGGITGSNFVFSFSKKVRSGLALHVLDCTDRVGQTWIFQEESGARRLPREIRILVPSGIVIPDFSRTSYESGWPTCEQIDAQLRKS
jgi:hypothetical protein